MSTKSGKMHAANDSEKKVSELKKKLCDEVKFKIEE